MKQAYAGKITALLEYPRTFLAYGTERGAVQRAFKVMLVVGTLLTLINHGQDFVSGVFSWDWIVPMVPAHLVPCCVAPYGEVQEKWSARERHRPQYPGCGDAGGRSNSAQGSAS